MGRGWSARSRGAAVGATAVLVSGASTVVVMRAQEWADGFWGASPAVVLSITVSVMVSAAVSFRLASHDRVVGRWALGLTLWLALWSAALAGSTMALAQPEPLGQVWRWSVLLAHSGHVPLLPLLQCVLLIALGSMDRRAPHRAVLGLLLLVPVAGLLSGVVAADFAAPFDRTAPPWAALAQRLPAVPVIFDLLFVPWLASVLVAPVLTWRAVGRAREGSRRPVLVLALAALLPVVMVLACVAMLPSLTALDLPQPLAVDLLMLLVALVVPLTLAAVGLATRVGTGQLRQAGERLHTALVAVTAMVLVVVVGSITALQASVLAPWSLVATLVATATLVVVGAWAHGVLVRRLERYADPATARLRDLLAARAGQVRDSPATMGANILREVLRDPHLRVAYRLPGDGCWCDSAGALVPSPAPGPRATTVPDASGGVVAVVAHSAPAEEVAGALAAVGEVLERGALELTVRDQQRRLELQRAEAERAAQEERHRIERDLHDTVQGRLLAVALQLQDVQRHTSDPAAELSVEDAVTALRTAIGDLRGITTGSAPVLLAEQGLSPALTDLAARMPVPVTLTLPEDRLPAATEATAYRVVSEALTNVVKHAGPCRVQATVRRQDAVVMILVQDSGVGGADLRAGTGLRGLAERVSAAGGTLLLSEASGHGTVLEVVLPCAP
jgi:signal transduction histidine kinase